MHQISVISSDIASIGYDSATCTLEVESHTGETYQYLAVPIGIYHGLMDASSHGSYFAQYVKNSFSCNKI